MHLKSLTNFRHSVADQFFNSFWMELIGARADQFVRVYVTYEALASLDPRQIRDREGAWQTFNCYLALIERSASVKFIANGPDEKTYQGQPTLLLMDMDLRTNRR